MKHFTALIFLAAALLALDSSAETCAELPPAEAFTKTLMDARNVSVGGLTNLDIRVSMVEVTGVICEIATYKFVPSPI